jgi:leader peptidase (prepilin peptidase)/N-methyltransferase
MIALPALIAATLGGACVGSYSATAALRMAREEQSLFGRSACDSCGVQLGFLRTIPVLSYAHASGACASCGGRIDPWHLAGEVVGAVVVMTASLAAGLASAIALSLLGFALLAASIVDIKTHRLPNFLTLCVASCGVVLASLKGPDALWVGLASAVLTFVLLEALRRGFLHWRGAAGLGLGDVKLVAALALWLGPATPWAIVLAAFGGLAAVALRPLANNRLAFGPFLASAAWIVGVVLELAK